MNRSFWEFISDCNFSKSACQVDVVYFNLLQQGYKHYHIEQYKEEFDSKLSLIKGNDISNKSYVISKGEDFFNKFIQSNKSADDIYVELPLDFELSNFSLIFTDIPSGDCYPEIKDRGNLFFATSTTDVEVLMKALLIKDTKSFLIQQIVGRSFYTEKHIKEFIKQQSIDSF